ncbi:MAG: hypothetical protein ABIJ14_00200 [Nanoarchaeota archaeon]
MENEDIKEYSELLEEAKEIKKSLNLESIEYCFAYVNPSRIRYN